MQKHNKIQITCMFIYLPDAEDATYWLSDIYMLYGTNMVEFCSTTFKASTFNTFD